MLSAFHIRFCTCQQLHCNLRLAIWDVNPDRMRVHARKQLVEHQQRRGAGGLSEGITALRQLARLRLQNILTAPLTDAVSCLTNLTSIGLYSRSSLLNLLPHSAAGLVGVQQLDVCALVLPPALKALTGTHACMFSQHHVVVPKMHLRTMRDPPCSPASVSRCWYKQVAWDSPDAADVCLQASEN